MQAADGRLLEALSTLGKLKERGSGGYYGKRAEEMSVEVREMIERSR
jgi:hypothetical protein